MKIVVRCVKRSVARAHAGLTQDSWFDGATSSSHVVWTFGSAQVRLP